MKFTGPVRSILIIANKRKPESPALAGRLQSHLSESGIKSDIYEFSRGTNLPETLNHDLAVTLGGDGTVLFAARALAGYDVPILPVNLGNFGFITETSVGDIYADVEAAISGLLDVGSRLMLEFSLEPGASSGVNKRKVQTGVALNDVVVSGSGFSKLIQLAVHIDETESIAYRADGIIFASSTGSTAYSAAAGGPILHPEIEAIILNPICPFTLSHRPLILPATCDLRVEIPEGQRTGISLTIDGQLDYSLEPGDSLRIKRSDSPVKILYSGKRSFYEVLRSKLHWSGGPQ